MRIWIRVLAFVCLAGCGPVIGDPCTVNTECGPGVCLNRDFAPGGLCSLVCTVGGSACPAGSVCVTRAVDGDTAGCMRSCEKAADCRDGYECRVERESMTRVCVAAVGIP